MPKFAIQYRQLKTDEIGTGQTLKNMIIGQLRKRQVDKLVEESAKLRIEDIDQDGSVVILNKITDPANWDDRVFGGQLIQLEPGATSLR